MALDDPVTVVEHHVQSCTLSAVRAWVQVGSWVLATERCRRNVRDLQLCCTLRIELSDSGVHHLQSIDLFRGELHPGSDKDIHIAFAVEIAIGQRAKEIHINELLSEDGADPSSRGAATTLISGYRV